MMRPSPLLIAAVLAVVLMMLMASGFANAQAPAARPAPAASAAAAAPPAAADFRCGGIGIDESEKMKAEAPRHDMIVTFASSTGAYLADIEFAIVNAAGQAVLSGRCTGPIMLVDLPAAGDYQFHAQYQGQSRRQPVRLAKPGKGMKLAFSWPAN